MRQANPEGFAPLHLAVRGHMGTGKDHDIEQFAARLGLPYFRIPLTGEVRDVTLIGSTKLHGDGKGGTESRWEDGDITRALRGPALLNLSELNAAGAETLFALHGLLDRYAAIDLPNGDTVALRPDVRVFGTMNPTDLRDYAGTQTLNKAFADRWVIWEKSFPGERADRVDALPALSVVSRPAYVTAIARLAVEVNASFEALDAGTRVETPLSLRSHTRPHPHRAAHPCRRRRSLAARMGGIRAATRRPLRPGPLRDRVERRGPQGSVGAAVLSRLPTRAEPVPSGAHA